jgi:hypothetical protein
MATDIYAGPGDAGDVADFGITEHAVRLGLAGKLSSDARSDVRGLLMPVITAHVATLMRVNWLMAQKARIQNRRRGVNDG